MKSRLARWFDLLRQRAPAVAGSHMALRFFSANSLASQSFGRDEGIAPVVKHLISTLHLPGGATPGWSRGGSGGFVALPCGVAVGPPLYQKDSDVRGRDLGG